MSVSVSASVRDPLRRRRRRLAKHVDHYHPFLVSSLNHLQIRDDAPHPLHPQRPTGCRGFERALRWEWARALVPPLRARPSFLLDLYVLQHCPQAESDRADDTGQGSYPHTPYSPTAASMRVWEEASDAILAPDMTIGYEARGMEEFAGSLRGGGCVRGWMRGWVEGRTLVREKSGLGLNEAMGVCVLMRQDELMKRPDVTAAFILTSTIAILASAQVSTSTATPPFGGSPSVQV